MIMTTTRIQCVRSLNRCVCVRRTYFHTENIANVLIRNRAICLTSKKKNTIITIKLINVIVIYTSRTLTDIKVSVFVRVHRRFEKNHETSFDYITVNARLAFDSETVLPESSSRKKSLSFCNAITTIIYTIFAHTNIDNDIATTHLSRF